MGSLIITLFALPPTQLSNLRLAVQTPTLQPANVPMDAE